MVKTFNKNDMRARERSILLDIEPDDPRKPILEKMDRNLLGFGKVVVPTMFTVDSAQFHGELGELYLDHEKRKVCIVAPRGHAKSSITALLLPLYHLFMDRGQKFIVLCSKTEGHAVRLLGSIKDVLNHSEYLRTLFGYYGEHSARVWKHNEIELKDGSTILCRGTGQQVVGLKKYSQRPTLIILDDPEDMTNTKTAESMEFNLRWLLQSLLPAADAKIGKTIVIGTPQHQRCMVEMLGKMEGWVFRRYKAIQDDGKWDPDDPKPASVLWPSMQPLTLLYSEFKSLDSIGRAGSFYREYQCQITGDEDQIFKAKYLKEALFHVTYEFGSHWVHVTAMDGKTFDPPKVMRANLYMGVDPASSTSDKADYTAICLMAVVRRGYRFVLPMWRKRAVPMEVAEKIIEMYQKYKPLRTNIETVGYQEMLRGYIRQVSKVHIPGTERQNSPRNSKSSRLETLQPFFSQGLMYLAPGNTALRDQLIMYPRSDNDDDMDALYYANMDALEPEDTPYPLGLKKMNDKMAGGFLSSTAFSEGDSWLTS